MDLIRAIRHNDIGTVRGLLDEGINIGVQSEYGYTALMYAVMYDHVDMARLLLDRGTNPYIQNDGGYTALMYAVIYDHVDMVRLLLDRGTNPYIQSEYGYTAYTLTNRDFLIREMLREAIAKYGKSMYQTKDKSREYMSSVYSDVVFI